jgi:hypothetical protein
MDILFGTSSKRRGVFQSRFDLKFPLGTFKPGYWHDAKSNIPKLRKSNWFQCYCTMILVLMIAFIETVAAITEVRPDNLGFTSDQAVYSGFRD